MSPSQVPENILKRIRHCFALSSSNWENEAAVALKMANKLMEEYGLSRADLDLEEGGQRLKESSVTHGPVDPKTRRASAWHIDIACVAKHLLGIEIILLNEGRGRNPTYIGTAEDVALGREIFQILLKEVRKMGREAYAQDGGAECQSFKLGCARRLRERAAEISKERKLTAERQQASGQVVDPGKALVLVKQNSLQPYMQKTWGQLRTSRSSYRGRFAGDAFSRGRAAGERVSLNFRGGLR